MFSDILATSAPQSRSQSEELVELLSQVTRLYMALLQLENFAVMNYCGLGKILKVRVRIRSTTTVPLSVRAF